MTCAVLLAAGSGNRFGEKKQYKLMKNKALYLYSLECFQSSGLFDEIVLVVPSEDKEKMQNKHPDLIVLSGGGERSDSVQNALKQLKGKFTQYVLIHDTARPLVKKEYLEKLIKALDEYPAVSLGYKISDAIKKADEKGMVHSELDRNGIWAVTTPQGYDFKELTKLYNLNPSPRYDESSLFLEAGQKVKILEMGRFNLKVTYPEDWKAAEKLLP